MKKICIRCEKEKDDKDFKNERKQICIQCTTEKRIEKMKKFKSIDLGIEALDKTLPYIQLLGVRFRKEISYDEAYELVKVGKATVHNFDTIFMHKDIEEIRIKVLKRDNYICHYCGEYGDTVDHVIPKSKGGEDTEENLVCSCFECNQLKMDLNEEEFKKIVNTFKQKKKIKQQTITTIKSKNKSNKKVIIEEKPQLSKLDSMLLQLKTKKQKWE